MRFYGIYKNIRKELFINKVTKTDIIIFQEWLNYCKINKCKENCSPAERCNFLCWDVAMNNIEYYNHAIYKITSKFLNRERIEGLVSLSIDNNNIVTIEGLEVAPWNRTTYKGKSRDFQKLGAILIGYSILYGLQNHFCGIIRLESLSEREEYYKNGINMNEKGNGEFFFLRKQCFDFIKYLKLNELFIER